MTGLSLLAGEYQNFQSTLAKICTFKQGVFPIHDINVGILAHFPHPNEKPQTNLMTGPSLLAGEYQNFLSTLAKNCTFKQGVFPTHDI